MNVVLVHGWMSTPNHHWFPWLVRELKGRGHDVIAPEMPHPVKPQKRQWVAKLKSVLADLDPTETILVGHSLGVPTILYCLQGHDGPKYLKAVLVSGFARKIPLLERVCVGYDMRLHLARIKPKCASWTCIHADNDPLVPFEEGEWLAERLGADLIVEKGRGHLTHYRGAVKLSSALGSIVGEINERFARQGVMLEEAGMRLESALGAINIYVRKNHPSLKVDPMIFLRSMVLKELERRASKTGRTRD